MPPHLSGRIVYHPQLSRMRNQLVDRTPMGTTVKVCCAISTLLDLPLCVRVLPHMCNQLVDRTPMGTTVKVCNCKARCRLCCLLVAGYFEA